MQVKFASDIIKITFEENEPFANRSLIMYGEVLVNGFAATVSTMNWISPNKGELLVSHDKEVVCNLISNYNEKSNFHIQLVEN